MMVFPACPDIHLRRMSNYYRITIVRSPKGIPMGDSCGELLSSYYCTIHCNHTEGKSVLFNTL